MAISRTQTGKEVNPFMKPGKSSKKSKGKKPMPFKKGGKVKC